ncbi:hypothetical protein [Desulfovibrio inopinatus]|uniref:hypothetical protein n=1 Tax=Desulfovibrio inopinatus TaxID=102109 RepID=UPI00048A3FEF|nr:hypothetical protein [Desulfovibrio inopinatus]
MNSIPTIFFWTMFVILFLFQPSHSAFAGPALQRNVTLTQPNGYCFEASARGDEFQHFLETPQGYTVLINENTWYYATLNDDGRLIPSTMAVSAETQAQEHDATLPFPKHLRSSLESLKQRTRGMAAPGASPTE